MWSCDLLPVFDRVICFQCSVNLFCESSSTLECLCKFDILTDSRPFVTRPTVRLCRCSVHLSHCSAPTVHLSDCSLLRWGVWWLELSCLRGLRRSHSTSTLRCWAACALPRWQLQNAEPINRWMGGRTADTTVNGPIGRVLIYFYRFYKVLLAETSNWVRGDDNANYVLWIKLRFYTTKHSTTKTKHPTTTRLVCNDIRFKSSLCKLKEPFFSTFSCKVSVVAIAL